MYNHIIICFDGDQSGYKAALRAAENIIDEMKPDKKISFLLLENNLDPDNYVNKYGKDIIFIQIQTLDEIHNKGKNYNSI